MPTKSKETLPLPSRNSQLLCYNSTNLLNFNSNSKNLAFIGNFAETPRDTVFTTEYSVRTAMEAVYTLLDIDRGVPEVFASAFDVRMLMNAMYYLNDQKKLEELDLPIPEKMAIKGMLKKVKGTYVEELLKKYKLI